MSKPELQPKLNLILLGLLQPKWMISKQRYAARTAQRPAPQGFTLLECVMAIAIMGLTFGLVLPPLLIASATRVQNRRAEQALGVAQKELDRIDALVRRSRHTPDVLPAVASIQSNLEGVAAPTQTFSQLRSTNNSCGNAYTGGQIPVNNALLVDVNGDCTADFMMQVFRDRGSVSVAESTAPNPRPSEFTVGVRVYSTVAGRSSATSAQVGLGGSLTGLETKQANLSMTSGETNQMKRPLSVVYIRYAWSDRDGSACAYLDNASRSLIQGCQGLF